MDPNEKKHGGEKRNAEATRRRAESDPGPNASARQQEIGRSGGLSSGNLQRGAPSEDVVERTLRERKPGEKTPELGEPDSGVTDSGELDE